MQSTAASTEDTQDSGSVFLEPQWLRVTVAFKGVQSPNAGCTSVRAPFMDAHGLSRAAHQHPPPLDAGAHQHRHPLSVPDASTEHLSKGEYSTVGYYSHILIKTGLQPLEPLVHKKQIALAHPSGSRRWHRMHFPRAITGEPSFAFQRDSLPDGPVPTQAQRTNTRARTHTHTQPSLSLECRLCAAVSSPPLLHRLGHRRTRTQGEGRGTGREEGGGGSGSSVTSSLLDSGHK